jgi:hypothetical protein
MHVVKYTLLRLVEVLLIGVVKPGLAKGDSEPDEVI